MNRQLRDAAAVAVVTGVICFLRIASEEHVDDDAAFYFGTSVAFVGSFIAGLIAGKRPWAWGAITAAGLALGYMSVGAGDPEGLWFGTAVVFGLPWFLGATAVAWLGTLLQRRSA